ncbi:GNAT family N-acetyltransferase [Halobacillus sp. A5]|uniref:GNAT family N-acetyltransferase n=1 Tax=Halobacillus sp. A5 TaxID=2880263 RepID=UPI0020A6BB1B|nr:GNAT family N-acetyltransferase [Halobacillus sp. A5]MCP3029294.1 GNAT family N-acetyltransferase [Halobacillus sp. A5]
MWVRKTFEELTKHELYSILQLRVQVFVVEQECPYPEIDGRDDECLHMWKERGGRIEAYCRIVPPENESGHYSIGRVLVTEAARGSGAGRELMNRAISFLKNEIHAPSISLHGQEYLRAFYGSFGFKEVSEVYLEDDIPHVDMLMEIR